jgi:hypothetical protein
VYTVVGDGFAPGLFKIDSVSGQVSIRSSLKNANELGYNVCLFLFLYIYNEKD